MAPKNYVENDCNEYIFANPDEVVAKLEEKFKYVCYLKCNYQIELLLKDDTDISIKNIDDCVMLMNNIASSTVSSLSKIKEDSSYVIVSKKMMKLSTANDINLEYYVIVNSKILLHAAYSFETNNNYSNHIKHCSYLILLVRNLCFHKHEDILTNNDKVLVGLFLHQIYFKLKRSNCVKDISNYFRRLIMIELLI